MNRRLLALLGLTLLSAPAMADNGCAALIAKALRGPVDLTQCNLAAYDDGRVMAVKTADNLYFVTMSRPGENALHYRLGLADGKVERSVGQMSVLSAPWPVKNGGFADAKQFYYPFNLASESRRLTDWKAAGFVCAEQTSVQVREMKDCKR